MLGMMFEELLAASLIHLYQSGTRDEATLLERGRARIANFSSQPHPITAPLQEASPTVADFFAVRPREGAVKRKVDRERLERPDREARLSLKQSEKIGTQRRPGCLRDVWPETMVRTHDDRPQSVMSSFLGTSLASNRLISASATEKRLSSDSNRSEKPSSANSVRNALI